MAQRTQTDGDGRHRRSGSLLATMAASIAAGIEANPNVDWPAERVAERAISVAKEIAAIVDRGSVS